jgi:hypothetical protein
LQSEIESLAAISTDLYSTPQGLKTNRSYSQIVLPGLQFQLRSSRSVTSRSLFVCAFNLNELGLSIRDRASGSVA